MEVPDTIVFDAEPLVVHADGEYGSETVGGWLDAVLRDESTGYVNYANLTEIRYVLTAKYEHGRDRVDKYIDWVSNAGVTPVGVENTWRSASESNLEHNPALGDSFAMATAAEVDGTLLVGGDDDYDDIDSIETARFREGSA